MKSERVKLSSLERNTHCDAFLESLLVNLDASVSLLYVSEDHIQVLVVGLHRKERNRRQKLHKQKGHVSPPLTNCGGEDGKN